MIRIRDYIFQKLEKKLGRDAEILTIKVLRSDKDFGSNRIVIIIEVGHLFHVYHEAYFSFGDENPNLGSLDYVIDGLARTILVEGMVMGAYKLNAMALKLMGSENIK